MGRGFGSAPSFFGQVSEWSMESVQKTDDGRLSEGSNPSASATALILCGIRAGEGSSWLPVQNIRNLRQLAQAVRSDHMSAVLIGTTTGLEKVELA